MMEKSTQQGWEEQVPHGVVSEQGDKEQQVTAGRRCLVHAWIASPQGMEAEKNLE